MLGQKSDKLRPISTLQLGAPIPADYYKMLLYAQSFGYKSFTKLQETVFCNPKAYQKDCDLFICGKTSSGKTLIPVLLYKQKLEIAKACGLGIPMPKMLFVIPYRALAAQKTRELCTLFQGENLTIVQSTGEFQQDDIAIQKGEVDIAVIITEKVFKYSSRDDTFLAKYDFLVLDEAGLIDSSSRGIRMDFILAWAKKLRKVAGKPQIIALGTPFYDWSSYIQNYQLNLFVCDERPVDLLELPVFYSKNFGIKSVTEDNPSLYRKRIIKETWFNSMKERCIKPAIYCETRQGLCAVEEPCRFDLSRSCPVTEERCTAPVEFIPKGMISVRNYIVEQICRYHLAQNHQILIFLNDREQVKQLCRLLYSQLKDLLPPAEKPETFRPRFLAECGLEEGDVYGILEEGNEQEQDMSFYCALSAGIGFHSRELPQELRTRIEEDLLESRKLKIVCSTETLAFGVNSTVDVVIISDLQKPYEAGYRSLTLNEYQNYAGRAGRMSQTKGATANNKGYVYVLISNTQESQWERINQEKQNLTPLYSRLFNGGEQFMAFALLNLLPENEDLMSTPQISNLFEGIPQPAASSLSFEDEIQQALTFLEEQCLIAQGRGQFYRSEQRKSQTAYGLTMNGKSLRGFLISNSDYILIHDSLQICIRGIFEDIDQEQLIYRLLSAHHVEADLKNFFSHPTANAPKETTLAFFQRRFDGTTFPEWIEQANMQKLFVLAAFLSWMDGDSSKQLYINFGVHYALLYKLAGQVGYLLEIAQAMMPAILNKLWDSKVQAFEKYGIGEQDFIKELENKCQQIRLLFCSVCYGLNQKVWNKLQTFLQEQSDEKSAELLCRISVDHIEPSTARLLRRIAIRFRFFSMPSLENAEDKELRNNYRNQRWQYGRDIREMGLPVEHFFEQIFGIVV